MSRYHALGLATIVSVLFCQVCHGQYVLDFTAQYGSADSDVGSSLTVTDGGGGTLLVVTGRSGVDSGQPSDPDAAAAYDPAHLFWDGDADVYTGGLGLKPGIGVGSTGVSGSGAHEDEDISFAFANGGVHLDTVTLTLNGLDGAADDPVIWVTTTAGRFLIDEAAILGAATPNGGSGTAAESLKIDFNGFAGTVGGSKAVVTSFVLRETAGEVWIKETEFGFAVPEPGSATLAGISSLLFLLRRKRKA